MANEATHKRFQYLQTKEREGGLTTLERTELSGLVQAFDVEEALSLVSAKQNLQETASRLEAQNSALKSLVKRRERLARRLEKTLQSAESEQNAIQKELTLILGEQNFLIGMRG